MTKDNLMPIRGAAHGLPVVCAGCGCACDDLTTGEIDIACELGRHWFGNLAADEEPAAWNDGQGVAVATAMHRAAELLAAAKSPLITGLTYTTCEAQLAAIDLAAALSAVIDPLRVSRGPHGTLLQNLGLATASFGELRDRAEAIVLCEDDPVKYYPRFWQRYATQQPRLNIASKDLLASVAVLRALLRGDRLSDRRVENATGKPLAHWQTIFASMRGAKYLAVLLPSGDDNAPAREAVAQLVREMNAANRCVAVSLSPGNAAGAANVLTAATGFPCAVSFATGEPRFDPLRFSTRNLLARHEADVVLCIGDNPPPVPPQIPCLVIGGQPRVKQHSVAVEIRTARPGVQCGGTMFRADGIALPLRNVAETTLPDDETVLRELISRVAGQKSAKKVQPARV